MNFEKKRKRQNGRQRRNGPYKIYLDEWEFGPLTCSSGGLGFMKTVSFEEFARDYPHPEEALEYTSAP